MTSIQKKQFNNFFIAVAHYCLKVCHLNNFG